MVTATERKMAWEPYSEANSLSIDSLWCMAELASVLDQSVLIWNVRHGVLLWNNLMSWFICKYNVERLLNMRRYVVFLFHLRKTLQKLKTWIHFFFVKTNNLLWFFMITTEFFLRHLYQLTFRSLVKSKKKKFFNYAK